MLTGMSFNYFLPTKILFGLGKAKQIVQECNITDNDKILIVADPYLVEKGFIKKITDGLEGSNIDYEIFSDFEPNPSTASVEAGAKLAKKTNCNYIVTIGGGSSMDTAKGIALRAVNEGHILDYSRIGNLTVKNCPLPIIAIPTTAGTGSEVTPFAVLTDTENSRKIAVAHPLLFPKIAVVDPELTISMPSKLTAETGMDALTHAIEAYVTINAQPITDSLAIGAIKIIGQNICKVVANGDNIEARSNMLLASTMAGIAFSMVGLGIVHSTAHALGGVVHLSHGVSNALMLPYVMEYNLISKPEKFRDIADTLGENTQGLPLLDAAKKAVKAVKNLNALIGIPEHLGELGVKKDIIEELAQKAVNDVGTFPRNPRKSCLKDIIELYEKAL